MKYILKNYQSPGDIVMLTAAVRDLKLSHPEIEIDVDTGCSELWENNPHLTKGLKAEIIKADYPLIHESNEGQHHFIHAFRLFLEDKLNLRIKPTKFKGDIHISDEEKGWTSQIEDMGIKNRFWIINAGGKYDFTAKWWSPISYQKVIDHFKGKITFVQVGQKEHWHPKLNGVVDLIGKTDLRQLIRLVYHSSGVVTGVSLLMHLAAAIESKHGLLNRPGVVISGGREPVQWEAYPHHRYLAVNGAMTCCDNGGCWKSRCQLVGDGDKKDKEELCLHPVELRTKPPIRIPKCMDMIKADDVIRAIQTYYTGGVLDFN
ncbi:MAG TPA: glycosyltransferase family 9 protein [Sedimentisphaerales bacterium]|nr:glycosyltransferase family 9 protein [Sedimentisphaerales bacterium]